MVPSVGEGLDSLPRDSDSEDVGFYSHRFINSG